MILDKYVLITSVRVDDYNLWYRQIAGILQFSKSEGRERSNFIPPPAEKLDLVDQIISKINERKKQKL